MFKVVFPEKDSFISNHPRLVNRNFGNDEILEIENRFVIDSLEANSYIQLSRGLIKFNLSDLFDFVDSQDITPKYYLKLYTAEALEVPAEYTVIANPISQSWEPGVGRLFDDLTTEGVSWNYRDYNAGTPWRTQETYSISISSSVSGSSIIETLVSSSSEVVVGGSTWYEVLPLTGHVVPTASILIPTIYDGSVFTLTSPENETYTFSCSQSLVDIHSGNATASIEIISITNHDRFTISANCERNITVINENPPNDCENELYISWSGGNDVVEAKTSILFTSESISVGSQFKVSDGITEYTLIATDNLFIPDNQCVRFFYVESSSIENNVVSLANEINSLPNLYLSSSASGSYLLLESLYLGEAGNSSYIWNVSDTSISSSVDSCGNTSQTVVNNKDFLIGGSGVGLLNRFNLLVNKLSEISSSCGFTFTASPFEINFVADVSGSEGNSYYFSSGLDSASFGGGITYQESQSLSDSPSSNTYYFKLFPTQDDTVYSLSEKINSVVSFVSSSASASVLSFEAAGTSELYENICFTYDTVSVCLSESEFVYYATSSASQSFKFETSDLSIDVTNIVTSWHDGLIPNEGFILRHSEEGSRLDYGKLRFFSQNTNTIYIPQLIAKWDNQIYNTGSLEELDICDDVVVYINNLNSEYYSKDIVRINITARPTIPTKTFSNQLTRYNKTWYLPTDSVYAIQDAESEEFVLPFDSYNTISVDNGEVYFDLDMSSLPQERYFRILFKLTKNGNTKIFKDRGVFKISR